MSASDWKRAEQVVAQYLRDQGFSLATTHRAALGNAGVHQESDIVGVPGAAFEVKARKNLDIPAALRQADNAAVGRQIPIVVAKPIGIGMAGVAYWPCFLYLRHLVPLLPREGEL
jgi:predicted RecB family endonuclease